MRPQSAKLDFKRNMRQSSAEQVNQQQFQKQQQRKHVRLIKPDLTSHDYSRILPQKIQQDKQRLYSEALKLKQMLNQTSQENLRLKTKISVLEKEKNKINKYIQTAPEGLGSKMSRLNLYGSRSNEVSQQTTQKDNMIVRNLKKLIREGKQENDSLRMQNNKIKKMMKYTKINELEILFQTVVQENKKLNQIVRDYAEYASNHEQIQHQNQTLKKYIEEEIIQKQKYEQQREKYEEIIDEIQQELKSQKQRHNNKQAKMINQLKAERRKVSDLGRRNEQLSRVIKSLRENIQYLDQKNKNASKNIVKVSKSLKNSNNNQKLNTQKSQQSLELQKNYFQVIEKNKQLQKQLNQCSVKLQQANKRIKQIEIQVGKNSKNKLSSEQFSRQIQNHEYINGKYLQLNEENYTQQFQEEQNIQKVNNHKEHHQLEDFRRQFQQSQAQQQLFKKNDSELNKEKKKKKKTKKSPQKQTNKSSKKQLSEIRQILTYRMKAQRYPFEDIKLDIQKSSNSTFSYTQLSNMLVNEPFYLTQQYMNIFLAFCFQKEQIRPSDSISSQFLIEKLRKVIDDFELKKEDEEAQMITSISQMASAYPQHLQAAFENMQNGQGTISKSDLTEMFQKLELQQEYIDLIIAQLSLYSTDLQHLNFNGFFERFFIDEDDYENYAIEEQGQQSQQSKKHSSRVRVNKSSQKIIKHQQSGQIDDL